MKTIPFMIVLMLFPLSSSLTKQKEIIGYFPSWKWRDTNCLMTYDKIPYKKFTIINYAFWYPTTSGKLAGINPVGDSINLKRNNGKPSLIDLAHKNKVKVVLSIGGWEDSENFPLVASSESLRTAFAQSCVHVIKEYNLDGIDIDWEFPNLPEHNGTPADIRNYTLLLQTVKDSLDNFGRCSRKKYLLTAALPTSSTGLKNFEMHNVADILDMLNIMTYDYSGTWAPVSGYNSPLFAPANSDSESNIDATVKFYTQHLKISASKINIGVAFYAQPYAQCSALNSKHSGFDTTLFNKDGAFYYDIAPLVSKTTRHWDDNAKVPYLTIPESNTFISYDDEESVGLKAQYVLQNNIHGVIIWEITGDCLPDGSTPLLNVLSSQLSPQKGIRPSKK